MKLLLDTCVWGGTRLSLQEAGHDVIWTGAWDKDPGDEEIIAIAYREQRVLVTLDKDFGELAIVYGKSHAGIIRLAGIAARQQSLFCLEVIRKYSKELSEAAIITVTPERIRVRLSSNE